MMRPFSSTPLYGSYSPLTPPPTPSSSASSSPIERFAPPARSGIKLRVAAGGSGKGKAFVPERDIYGLKEFEKQKGGRRMETGQDSFFISPLRRSIDEDGEGLAVGVADGVGGYIESGFDSADFSHTLCEYMAHEATVSTPSNLSAQRIMRKGYDRVVKDKIVQGGGSTACVGVFRGDGAMEVANLGDSGYYIFRLGRLAYASKPQTHAFNTPYQLSIIPPSLRAQAARYGGVPLCDLPRDADLSKHRLEAGDVVLFATDGVLDNLFTQQVLQIVTEEMCASRNWRRGEEVRGFRAGEGTGDLVERKIVERVVRAAKKAGLDTKTDGPFAKEVQRVYPFESYNGGKPDDVGVVCVVVEGRPRGGRL